MKTTIKVFLLMAVCIPVASMGRAPVHTEANAPPKPSEDVLYAMMMADVIVIEPSDATMYVTPHDLFDVVHAMPIKLDNSCTVPMRPGVAEQKTKEKPFKVITWPDSKRYIRWLLRPQCTAIH